MSTRDAQETPTRDTQETPTKEIKEKTDEEQSDSIQSWDEVASWMQERGCNIIGIYVYHGPMEFHVDFTLYTKGSKTYVNTCRICNTPVDFEMAEVVRKINSNTYLWSEPGDDMPEKYIIRDGKLINYCYNPGPNEWVEMGSYYQVY